MIIGLLEKMNWRLMMIPEKEKTQQGRQRTAYESHLDESTQN